MDHELGVDLDAEFLCIAEGGVPAGVGVRAKGLAVHEGDLVVAEIAEV